MLQTLMPMTFNDTCNVGYTQPDQYI